MSDVNLKANKVIRNGMVAVLYSPGYGAGWSTWNSEHKELLLFHPKLVEYVESGRRNELTEEVVKQILGLEGHVCCLGADDLEIAWIAEGEDFYVEEYDGSESITHRSNGELWTRA